MVQTPDEFERAQASAGERGAKRSLKAYQAPWDTPPTHCLDLVVGRSRADEWELSRFWEYISSPTKILEYRTECPCFCC